MGGTYMKFRAGPNRQPSLDAVAGQRGVQPAESLPDVAAFVTYCHDRYGVVNGYNQNGLFFFCRFDP